MVFNLTYLFKVHWKFLLFSYVQDKINNYADKSKVESDLESSTNLTIDSNNLLVLYLIENNSNNKNKQRVVKAETLIENNLISLNKFDKVRLHLAFFLNAWPI